MRFGHGQRPLGASTITQQLVRHFLLTNEVSVSRKIKEALLAYRIESALSKDRILEIYLNEIYLGAGAYGVAAAADTYFGKKLDQLTIAGDGVPRGAAEGAQQLQPGATPEAAQGRRDWVLDGMADNGWITAGAGSGGQGHATRRAPPQRAGPAASPDISPRRCGAS